MESYNRIVEFFQQGGLFMYPIVVVLALGLAIAIERYVYLSASRARTRSVWNELIPLVQAGKLREARNLAERSGAALARIVRTGLSGMEYSRSKHDVELALEEGLMEVVPRLEKRTHYLATLANTATLLGLLGTIIGLINAFTSVSLASASERADMLSASISMAMNTTAFGLMVGIPLLLIHAMLQAKTTQLVDNLEMAAVKVINGVSERLNEPRVAPEEEAEAA